MKDTLLSKIRIVTDIAPTDSLTAGIVLEQILMSFPINVDVALDVLVDDGLPNYKVSEYLSPEFGTWHRKPQELWPRSRYFKPFRNLGEIFAKHDTVRIIKHILINESRNKSDFIVVVIQGQTTIRVAAALINQGYKVSTIHWDPWSWWAREKSVPTKFSKEVDLLNKSLTNGGVHLLPSTGFKEALCLNDDQGLILYPHVGKFITEHEAHFKYRIVFIGQNYSKKEIDQFINYLEDKVWILNGLEVELHVYGNTFTHNSPQVINHGWCNYKDLPSQISKYDAAFLPYPRDSVFKDVAIQSFPSKFATYVTANLPIIYLGPIYSSFAHLIQENGVSLETIDLESWELGITELRKNRPSISEKNFAIYEKLFSFETQNSTVEKWLELNLERRVQKNPKAKNLRTEFKVRDFNRTINASLYSKNFAKILFAYVRIWRIFNQIVRLILRRIGKIGTLLIKIISKMKSRAGLRQAKLVAQMLFRHPYTFTSVTKKYRDRI